MVCPDDGDLCWVRKLVFALCLPSAPYPYDASSFEVSSIVSDILSSSSVSSSNHVSSDQVSSSHVGSVVVCHTKYVSRYHVCCLPRYG